LRSNAIVFAHEPRLFTVREVAAQLGIRPGLAYSLIARGDLVAVRVGRYLRVTESALVRYVERSVADNRHGKSSSP
jgi:excisionase family DNA binding protein